MPQMNIGIYEDHAFPITNLDRVKKHYACADLHKLVVCGHAGVFTRRETKVECRGEKIWSP